MHRAYSRIKADRDAEDARRAAAERKTKRSAEEWKADAEEEIRKRRAGKRYMQPTEATWREFMQHRGWTPADLRSLPDDWLYGEWMRYTLRNIYGIDRS